LNQEVWWIQVIPAAN